MDASAVEKKELGDLLKNMQNALKYYSLTELNNALLKALNETNPKKSLEVSTTIDVICQYYKITKKGLIHAQYKNNDAKKMVYQLLYFTFNLPIRYISKRIFFYKSHTAIGSAVAEFKKLNKELKQDREHKILFDELQGKIIERIANKKITIS